MTIASIRSLSKNFGIKPLLKELTFAVTKGERVAIVGANGSGKSTLLNIIAGKEEADNGEVVLRKDVAIAYVTQSEKVETDQSISQYLNLGDYDDYQRISKISSLLEEAGFDDFDAMVRTLSGGWQKRLSIVKALSQEPDLLILDEPTNHLDILGILWLEDLFLQSNTTIICVSHDRYFLERVATRTIELDARFPKGFLEVEGGYSDLLEKRTDTLDMLASQRSSLANKVRREVEWLRQGAKARTTKSKHRTDEAHRLISELNSINLKEIEVDFEFSSTQRKTKDLVKLQGISKAFDQKQIVNNFSLTFTNGSRTGIVGANGTGKTTLLKLITGSESVDKGKIVRASNLQFAFFGQHREQLKGEKTISEMISPDSDSVVFNDRSIHIASWIRRFSFRHDQLNQPVKSLSGGEQARLLLAKLMLEPADILIFDEPTNDLDISTLEVLEQSFTSFQGALILVTHDRYMIDRVCTQLIGLHGSGIAHTYSDYLQFEDLLISQPLKSAAPLSPHEVHSKTGLSFDEKKELQSIERKIAKTEGEIESLRASMHQPSNSEDLSKLQTIQSSINNLESKLQDLITRWELLEAQNIGN